MTVGVLKEPVNIWGFLSLGWPYIGALSVVWLTHILARRREKMAIKDKAILEQMKADREQAAEVCFIGSQLIFILESFAVRCADVAIDKGKKKRTMIRGLRLRLFPEQRSLKSVWPKWKGTGGCCGHGICTVSWNFLGCFLMPISI
ncbi:hypothetical protein [Raoultella ornithinolytica]|uniref:hypothetical protein n=1 Tax=Raoultella ornithinolytica TaxID=54291 RepID=UPI001F3BDCE2|nr:hypothetical protein [Raoultella ornithinolytica]MCF1306886.1 hypothetical protein [Raoultella ornithinolytica]